MKVCIPVNENKGLDSVPYGHFGSAPLFLTYDLEKGELRALENEDLHHEHGMCQPLKAIGGETVDAVLVGGIGAGAISKLNNMGIKVYRAARGTVSENIELFKQNALTEFSINDSCSHDGCGH